MASATRPPPTSEPPVRAWRTLAGAASLFLVTAFCWLVYRREVWRSPALAGTLAAPMAAQIALHWLYRRFARTRAGLSVYFAVQLALIFTVGAVGRSDPWMYQLLLMLLAEAVAVLVTPRAQAFAAVAQVALATVAAIVLFGPGAIVRALMHSIPMAASIAGFGMLHQRLVRSREESRAALEALDAAHRRLVEYAGELERLTVAAERQRLARELHDTLAQGLVGLTLQLEALDAHLARGELAKAIAIVQGARQRARSALHDARSAIADLREPSAAPLGEALRAEAERFTAVTGIPCAVAVEPSLALTSDAEAHAIRCVAEGLSNVARHASARSVSISVAAGEGAIELRVADDGIGFDPVSLEPRPGHYGLVGLRERARIAGGSLEIDSRPGAGTVLKLHLPAAGAEAAA